MIRVRESETSDNDALLDLTRSAPMSGTISLRIDRDPRFERLVSLRGEGKTFVAVETGRIIGCVSVTHRTAYVNGNTEPIGYLSDLKVHPSERGGSCAFLLMKVAHDYAIHGEADVYFCVVADGNESASSLLSGRASFPPFRPLGRFLVHSMLPTPFRAKRGTYAVDRLADEEIPAVCAFVNETNSRLLFSPLLERRDFVRNEAVADSRQFTLVARYEGRIVATVTGLDTSFVKSNVVIGMPVHLRVVVGIMRSLEKALPVIHVPTVGEAMKLLYLRHVAVTPGHERALLRLVSTIRNIAFEERYSFITIGLHDSDVRRRIFRRIPRFLFISRAYAVSLRHSATRLSALSTEVPVEDFALV